MLNEASAVRAEGESGTKPNLQAIAMKLRADTDTFLQKLHQDTLSTYAFHSADIGGDVREAGRPLSAARQFRLQQRKKKKREREKKIKIVSYLVNLNDHQPTEPVIAEYKIWDFVWDPEPTQPRSYCSMARI